MFGGSLGAAAKRKSRPFGYGGLNLGLGLGDCRLQLRCTWRPRGRSKSVISRFIIKVAPFRILTTLLITHLLSPLGLQVGGVLRFERLALGFGLVLGGFF